MKVTSMIASAVFAMVLMGCSGGNGGAKTENEAVNAEEFAATQPIESGQYRAVSYDVVGPNERKGPFDGRVMVSLAPEQSALYVYENGNRAKIEAKIILQKPFEKGDSGIYRSVDVNNLPVTITPDSTEFILSYEKGKNLYNIGVEKTPMSTASAVEMIEKIADTLKKNK